MESEKYLPELMAEKDTLDPSFRHSLRLLEQGKANKDRRGAVNTHMKAGTSPPVAGFFWEGGRFGDVLPGT